MKREENRECIVLKGDISSDEPASGCVFYARCFQRTERCATEVPSSHLLGDELCPAMNYGAIIGCPCRDKKKQAVLEGWSKYRQGNPGRQVGRVAHKVMVCRDLIAP
ncbi:MAG: hypothetical protein D3913_09685 [Candidatus Electrothrix sp. LOE1_4_5]|nr:hypothetical protein [Candidatus Electrothrix gigas]